LGVAATTGVSAGLVGGGPPPLACGCLPGNLPPLEPHRPRVAESVWEELATLERTGATGLPVAPLRTHWQTTSTQIVFDGYLTFDLTVTATVCGPCFRRTEPPTAIWPTVQLGPFG
jgi:hypothetical protein